MSWKKKTGDWLVDTTKGEHSRTARDMANSAPLVIVRIKGANSEGKDWMIPSEVSFRMVLVRKSTFFL